MCLNDDWMKQSQYTSLGKILFLNGYFDMKNHNWYAKESTKFDASIVFMGRIHHNFEHFDDNDMTYMEERMRGTTVH